MNEVIIHAEKLGKLYRIGERLRYKTLRDTLNSIFVAPIREFKQRLRLKDGALNYIWALKSVSFEIKRGEIVGIIGRNGAGKTTLLKILSRITPPTEGYARVYGRMGLLLEVGTGFHPELTGGDNIYLNGAILGMKKAEIKRKFDEIVSFAEVEKFIDTPVKHYSSGMYVRLAFAIAAHLEPEILLVDEVLAVGDTAFQNKCLGKMGDVAKSGRTVLFVSHNLAAIHNLCSRAILLNDGQIYKEGFVDEVIRCYHNLPGGTGPAEEKAGFSRSTAQCWGNGEAKITKVKILSRQKEPRGTFDTKEVILINIGYVANKRIENPVFGIAVYQDNGAFIIGPNTKMCNFKIDYIEGEGEIEFEMSPFLLPGNYELTAAIHTEDERVMFDHQHRIKEFRIVGQSRLSIINALSLSGSIGRWNKR